MLKGAWRYAKRHDENQRIGTKKIMEIKENGKKSGSGAKDR